MALIERHTFKDLVWSICRGIILEICSAYFYGFGLFYLDSSMAASFSPASSSTTQGRLLLLYIHSNCGAVWRLYIAVCSVQCALLSETWKPSKSTRASSSASLNCLCSLLHQKTYFILQLWKWQLDFCLEGDFRGKSLQNSWTVILNMIKNTLWNRISVYKYRGTVFIWLEPLPRQALNIYKTQRSQGILYKHRSLPLSLQEFFTKTKQGTLV